MRRHLRRIMRISDAINGFLPRARSSGPRSSVKNKNDENVRR